MRSSGRSILTTILLITTTGCARAPATTCPDPPAAVATELTAGDAPPQDTTATEAVADVIRLVNAGDAEGLHARFSPEFQQAVPLAALAGMLGGIVTQRGRLVEATPIDASARAGTFQVTTERGAWKLQIALGDGGIITGLGLTEPDPPAPPLARSAPAGLPFRGEWLVFWGGDRPELNHHLDHPSQRRAADLVRVDAAGKTHQGEGRELADYYAYGQDILAMADGVVVTAIDGIADNTPGELNPLFAAGNLVILRHEDQIHSAYAHLVPGSVKVKVGARVHRGQVLGACGNSGNSSEPHLHVQFQDGPRFEKSWGIEASFAEAMVVRDGASARHTDYSFLKGDLVSPAKRPGSKP